MNVAENQFILGDTHRPGENIFFMFRYKCFPFLLRVIINVNLDKTVILSSFVCVKDEVLALIGDILQTEINFMIHSI